METNQNQPRSAHFVRGHFRTYRNRTPVWVDGFFRGEQCALCSGAETPRDIDKVIFEDREKLKEINSRHARELAEILNEQNEQMQEGASFRRHEEEE